jgi:hypothetical protein
MDHVDFVFTVEELDGMRVLRLVMPGRILTSSLAAASANYLALWDDDRPTVGLGDLRHLREISSEMVEIFTVFARRVTVLPNYVATAWFTGPNNPVTERLRALAEAAGRDRKSIVASEREALAYLRERIAAYRASGADRAEPGL